MVTDELTELKSRLYDQERMIEQLTAHVSMLRRELVKSQKSHTELYDFSPSVYFTIDKNYIIQLVNFQASCLLGIDRLRLHTKNFLNFVTANSKNTFINSIDKLYDTRRKQTCDIGLLGKGGRKLSVILESMLIDGELIRLCLFDVTHHRININQQLQLETTFHLINHLFQHSTDALAALDNMLNIKLLNHSFIDLFSTIFATKITAGMNLTIALMDFPDLKSKIIHACQDVTLGGRTYVMLENHKNQHEIYYCYEICIHFVRNQSNQQNEIFLRIKNLTEMKSYEKQHIKQQTAINQVSKTSVLGELASDLAHEINQPLTAIMAYSQSCLFILNNNLSDHKNCNDLLNPLQQIALQGEHAGAIIHSIKNFMREDPLHCEESDVNMLIRQALSILSYEIMNLKFKITLNLMDNLPRIMINKIHIMQIILNLTRNSMEALQNDVEENPEVRIETNMSNDYIQVHVRDNGLGIPTELRHKILHSYFTTKPSGTGLGLRICRTLIEKHRGELLVQQHEEKGAWFTFTLPINRLNQNTHA